MLRNWQALPSLRLGPNHMGLYFLLFSFHALRPCHIASARVAPRRYLSPPDLQRQPTRRVVVGDFERRAPTLTRVTRLRNTPLHVVEPLLFRFPFFSFFRL